MEVTFFQALNMDPTPVVLKPITSIPDYIPPSPDQILQLGCFQIRYYKATLVSNGYYELVSSEDEDNVIRLYQYGMKTLVKNLERAFRAAASVEKHIEEMVIGDTFSVCEISQYNNTSIHLMITVGDGKANIALQVLVTDVGGDYYPTGKCLAISPADNPVTVAEFIKKKN